MFPHLIGHNLDNNTAGGVVTVRNVVYITLTKHRMDGYYGILYNSDHIIIN